MSVDCLLWRISHSEQDIALKQCLWLVLLSVKEFIEHLSQDDFCFMQPRGCLCMMLCG